MGKLTNRIAGKLVQQTGAFDNLDVKGLIEKANSGDVKAMNELGVFYIYGKSPNPNEAIKWLSKAVELGDSDAMFALGQAYIRGLGGVPVNNEKGKELMRKAIDLENPKAIALREAMREDGKGGKGCCYVATCVYGSYDCPEVWTLRRFRDDVLSRGHFGRLFIRLYYATGPKIVKCMGSKKWFNDLSKPLLNKIVCRLQKTGISGEPYDDK